MLYIDRDLDKIDLQSSMDLLSDQRREQVLRITHEQGRRENVAAYLLLKKALHEEYGIDEPPIFGYEDTEKPFLIDHPEIHFNLSHCKTAAVCVLDSVPVGVDVEKIRPFRESLARHTMNEEEMSLILSGTSESEFIRLWTMKESYLKLKGLGIRADMRNVLQQDEAVFETISMDDLFITVCRYRTF
ncbi:MAG: 4'-phosphopantetheinyl transferase superfamily protein [Bacteroidales bacterium]|nr:4'-phosphopantetheinyl transferase superfamily protein [Bacteroidales bacterium]